MIPEVLKIVHLFYQCAHPAAPASSLVLEVPEARIMVMAMVQFC